MNEKNQLFRRETELYHTRRMQELEDEHAELEQQYRLVQLLRCRFKGAASKVKLLRCSCKCIFYSATKYHKTLLPQVRQASYHSSSPTALQPCTPATLHPCTPAANRYRNQLFNLLNLIKFLRNSRFAAFLRLIIVNQYSVRFFSRARESIVHYVCLSVGYHLSLTQSHATVQPCIRIFSITQAIHRRKTP